MNNRYRLFLLIPILFISLACQAVLNAWHSALPSEPSVSSITKPPGYEFTLTLTSLSSPIAPTVTTVFPSITAEPTLTFTVHPIQLEIFEELWQTVKEEYLYPDFNGIDWEAIHEEYLEKIYIGLTQNEFYLSMQEMVARLGDDHSSYQTPEQVAEEEAEYAGNLDYVGIGVLLMAIPEEDKAVILVTFPGSPAEQAGLRSRDAILLVDGEPILDENDTIKQTIRGKEGTEVTLTVQSPEEESRLVKIVRHRITGGLPVPYQLLETTSGLKIGYILLVTFNDSSIDDQVGQAISVLKDQAPIAGLIIDNRLNEGGADTVLVDTLAYFTKGTLGYFVSRNDERALEIEANFVNGSQDIPLVILIGTNTVSYGETFSGVLKDIGRAFLIGQTTEGNVETLWGYDFQDGSRLWLAHETFRPIINSTENWEETGITPHLNVPGNWYDVTFAHDPAILAALQYFEER